MQEEFNTLNFYKKKAARLALYLAIIGVIGITLSSIKTVVKNEYPQTPKIFFYIFIGIAIIELVTLLVIRKRMFISDETVIKNFDLLKWINVVISIINYTFIINTTPNQIIWATAVFYLLTIAVFQSFKCTGIAAIFFAIIAGVFLKTHSLETLQAVDPKLQSGSAIQLLQMELIGVLLYSYCSGHILANVGQDLMNKNTSCVQVSQRSLRKSN